MNFNIKFIHTLYAMHSSSLIALNRVPKAAHTSKIKIKKIQRAKIMANLLAGCQAFLKHHHQIQQTRISHETLTSHIDYTRSDSVPILSDIIIVAGWMERG